MDYRRFDNEQQILEALRNWLEKQADTKTLLLVGGGSSSHVFAKVWQTLVPAVQANIRLSLTDERFGPVGHSDSNWQLLKNLGVSVDDSRHLPVLMSGLDQQHTADKWADGLKGAVADGTKIMAIFGVGEDFHVAGIKPDSPVVLEKTKWALAYSANDFERITITPVFFPQVNSARLYAQGAAKLQVVESLRENQETEGHPCQLVKQTQSFEVYYQA